MYIVSGCLLGDNCKYNGGNNYDEAVERFLEGKRYVTVCPELMAGFPVPRPTVEIRDGRAVNRMGWDLTERFIASAEAVWSMAIDEAEYYGEEIEGAILKQRSPSCGAGKIYDGTFSGKTIEGYGFTAAYLKEMGIKLLTEEDFHKDERL